jgi:hypothetical protein
MSTEESTFDWEELFLCLADRRVIPIVGKELLQVSIDGETKLLERYLTERLSASLGVPITQLSPKPDLNKVALQYLHQGGDRRKIYSRLKAILDERELPVPEILGKLASITDFSLFVSLTFDSLLSRALAIERLGGASQVQSLAFSTSRAIEDLPSELMRLHQPFVYQLFGKISSTTDYAVTEEDYLEFLHVLQSETHRPHLLFDEFRSNHLLFLGCGFPDWLERFLVRTITNERLLAPKDTSQFMADEQVRQDTNLSFFLKQYRTHIFFAGNAIEFVDTLHDRWSEQNISTMTPPIEPSDEGKMDSGAIFLSYAHEDGKTVRIMKEALEKAGLDVWFDKEVLLPGDAWDLKIQRNIRNSAVFIPFISRQSNQRLEGYFRKEWKWAIERDKGMDESLRFIQPVILDDTPDNSEGTPDYLWSKHSSHFPNGQPTAEFVEHLKMLVRNKHLRDKGY